MRRADHEKPLAKKVIVFLIRLLSRSILLEVQKTDPGAREVTEGGVKWMARWFFSWLIAADRS
jgi:hypothetical protein